MINIERILVPVDFSQSSEKAVHYGVELMRGRKATLYFLHVIDQKVIEAMREVSIKGYKGDFVNALRKVIKDRENDLIQFVPEELREGMEVEFLIRRGDPVDEILTAAKELLIDLIVIGYGRSSDSTPTLVGNVTGEVLNRAPCPVLLVRPVERDFI